ncbi:MAG: MGMT family protein, partial [archaeon]
MDVIPMDNSSEWVSKIKTSHASPFYQSVWLAMLNIPKGKITTYGEIARAIGNPNASRAIGGACNQNLF